MLKRIIIIPVILAACLCNVHGQKVVRAADFYSLMHELDKTEKPNLRKDAFDFRTEQRHVYVSDEFADSFFKTDTTYVFLDDNPMGDVKIPEYFSQYYYTGKDFAWSYNHDCWNVLSREAFFVKCVADSVIHGSYKDVSLTAISSLPYRYKILYLHKLVRVNENEFVVNGDVLFCRYTYNANELEICRLSD